AGRGVRQGELEEVAAVAHRQPVGGGVRVAPARGAVHLEPEAPGGRCRPGCVPEPHGITYSIEDLRVAARDLARLAGCDGEDPRPQQPVAPELDQGRVAP